MIGVLAGAFMLVVGALWTAPTSPAPTSAVERAFAAYEEQRWDDAIQALREAYAAEPKPEYLYAQAQALRLADRCAEAIPTYQRFIAQGPPATDVADAEVGIELCRPDPVVPAPAPAAHPPPPETTTLPARVPTPDPEQARAPDRLPPASARWWRDPWGHGLTWSGTAVAVGGGALLGSAHGQQRHAAAADDEAAYQARLGAAPTLSRAGIGLLAAGGAVLVGGLVRFIVVRRRERRSTARAPRGIRSLAAVEDAR